MSHDSRRAALGIARLNKQIEAIKNSNLSPEEKERALKSQRKLLLITTIFVVVITILVAIAIVIGVFVGGNTGAWIMVGSLAEAIAVIIIYAVIVRKIPNDFTTYYSKVDSGFDGLDEETINRLKPTPKEEKLIKKYKVKSFIYTFLLVLAVVIELGIVLAFDLKLHSPLTYIVVIATFIVWWILEDTCRVEIHRLKSGYYKKTYGFVCQNCKNKVLINFNEIENYKDAPRNEQGIRVIPCRVCNHLVPMYNFDSSYKEYKKYTERIK